MSELIIFFIDWVFYAKKSISYLYCVGWHKSISASTMLTSGLESTYLKRRLTFGMKMGLFRAKSQGNMTRKSKI